MVPFPMCRTAIRRVEVPSFIIKTPARDRAGINNFGSISVFVNSRTRVQSATLNAPQRRAFRSKNVCFIGLFALSGCQAAIVKLARKTAVRYGFGAT